MGYIIDSTPEMGEYHVEVRRASFYLSGDANMVWYRPTPTCRRDPIFPIHEEDDASDFELSDDQVKPGKGWEFGSATRTHGIYVYQDAESRQGTAEILIEDIPKIRAALDQVESYVKERARG